MPRWNWPLQTNSHSFHLRYPNSWLCFPVARHQPDPLCCCHKTLDLGLIMIDSIRGRLERKCSHLLISTFGIMVNLNVQKCVTPRAYMIPKCKEIQIFDNALPTSVYY